MSEITYKLHSPRLKGNSVYIGEVFVDSNVYTHNPNGLSYNICIKLIKSRHFFRWRTELNFEPCRYNLNDLPEPPLVTLGKSLAPTLTTTTEVLTRKNILDHVNNHWAEYLDLVKDEIKIKKRQYEEYQNSLITSSQKGVRPNMKVTLASLSQELGKIAEELSNKDIVALSPLQEEYQDYFLSLLEKHDLKGIAGVDEAKLRAFFDDVSKGWAKGEGAKE